MRKFAFALPSEPRAFAAWMQNGLQMLANDICRVAFRTRCSSASTELKA